MAQLAEQQRRYDEAINSVRNLMTTPYMNQQQPPQRQLDSDKILTDPAAWQQDLVGNVAGAVQQIVGAQNAATFEALASSAKHLAKSDPKNAPIWERYGAEIEKLGDSPAVDPRLKGTKEFWDKAARVIQAEHIDDIIAERAQALAAEARQTTETGASAGYGLDGDQVSGMEKLRTSEWGKRLLDRYGEKGVLRNVEKLGITLDKYADMAAGTKVIVNPQNPAEWWNRDLVRGS